MTTKRWKWSRSVMSDSLQPHGLKLTRLLHPWDSQARILEWVAFPFSRGSSQPRSPTLQAYSLLSEPPGKPKNYHYKNNFFSSSLSSKFFSSCILNCLAFLIYAFKDTNFPLGICLVAFYKLWYTVILLSFSLYFHF